MRQDHTRLQTRSTLRPGEPGTVREVESYGDQLVAVRYRVDADTGERLKTVELLVDLLPPPGAAQSRLRRSGA